MSDAGDGLQAATTTTTATSSMHPADDIADDAKNNATAADVGKIFDEALMRKAEVTKNEVANAITESQRFPGDTGSVHVQIAVLTVRISALTEHLQAHRKDHKTRRAVVGLVSKRKRLLQYLKRKDFALYHATLEKHGLRPVAGTRWVYVCVCMCVHVCVCVPHILSV